MDKIEKLTGEVIKLIQIRESSSEKILVSFVRDSLVSLRDIIKKSKKYKIYLEGIDRIPFPLLEVSASLGTGRKGDLIDYESSGLFRIALSNGGFIYILKYLLNPDSSPKPDFVTLVFSIENTFKIYGKIKNKIYKKSVKPKKGVFKANLNEFNHMIVYKKKNTHKFPRTKIIHPVRDYIFDSINTFIREGHPYYEKFNLPFIKKVLLVGKTGTGKTSIARLIASSYADFCNVVWLDNFKVLRNHLARLEKYRIPSIVIYEDCESEFADADSNILNYMDGIDQPYVKDPVYMIFTTNYPEFLKERIRRRFDEIIHVGPLTGKYAIECAQSYFDNHLVIDRKHEEIFNNMTGWEIWRLWIASRNFCLNSQSELSIEVIEAQKKALKREFKIIEEEERKRIMGFRNDFSPF